MQKNKFILISSLSMVAIFFFGIILSVIKLRETNTLRSQAEVATTEVINCNVDPQRLVISSEEQGLLDMINSYRAANKLKTLVWSEELTRGASWMSEDMLTSGKLAHIDSLGRSPAARLMNCGYKNYLNASENIDSGTPSYEIIFNSWKHSLTHNTIMLRPDAEEAGIALSSNPETNSFYWTFNTGGKTISPTVKPTATAPTLKPSVSPTIPAGATLSPTSKPSATSIPAKTPTPVPTPVIVYPLLKSYSPNPANPGKKMTVTGTGGYLRLWNGELDRSTRSFQLYLNSNPNGRITCTTGFCQGEILIPEALLGNHIVKTEGGASLGITIVQPVPPSPTLTPTPSPHPDFTANPLDMQLFVSAKVTGIGVDGNNNPKNKTKRVEVGVYDTSNKQVTSGNGFIVYDGIDLFRGIIHLGPVENGIYYVKIKGDHILQETVTPLFQTLDLSRLNVLPETKISQGDLNDDNSIDLKDYNLALECFQNKRCEDYEMIDFNQDGQANVVDYNILLQYYWETPGD
jgi:uncharacterized protein YkwD